MPLLHLALAVQLFLELFVLLQNLLVLARDVAIVAIERSHFLMGRLKLQLLYVDCFTLQLDHLSLCAGKAHSASGLAVRYGSGNGHLPAGGQCTV